MLPFINFHTHHPVHEGEISLGGEECGMDRRWNIPLEEQEKTFRRCIAESEERGEPLVIHCVKALDEILRIHRDTKPTQPWMFHGFRGKPQQLQSLLAAGIYVSFGLKYNKESLILCPLDRMCLETDDDPSPIRPLYEEVARYKGISTEVLKEIMAENASILHKKKTCEPSFKEYFVTLHRN